MTGVTRGYETCNYGEHIMPLYDKNGRIVSAPTVNLENGVAAPLPAPAHRMAVTPATPPVPIAHAPVAPMRTGEPAHAAAGIGDIRTPLISTPQIFVD